MDKNGATRLSKLHLVRFGAKGSSLRWKPVDVNTAAAASETAKFVKALVFRSYVTETDWAKFLATPVQHLRQEMIHMQLDPTSLVPRRWSPRSR